MHITNVFSRSHYFRTPKRFHADPEILPPTAFETGEPTSPATASVRTSSRSSREASRSREASARSAESDAHHTRDSSIPEDTVHNSGSPELPAAQPLQILHGTLANAARATAPATLRSLPCESPLHTSLSSSN